MDTAQRPTYLRKPPASRPSMGEVKVGQLPTADLSYNF
jgi:hypothetical protein